ncbi:AAA family ATPase [Actinacidiphila sp. bgisy145]|uniref:AAA family ATPase n=1 Tax=Actinacidiphila sp. bgisy145 TaxID=3413792 RepID=UPI003EB7FE41
MAPGLFVDRTETMAELHALATGQRRDRAGWAMLVGGPPGIGKSALLAEYQQQLTASGLNRVYSVRCHPGIGPGLTYGPVTELLTLFARESAGGRRRLKRALKQAGQQVLDYGPALLSMLVPGLGEAFAVGRDLTRASVSSGSIPFDSLVPFQQGAAMRIVDELVRLMGEDGPAVVIVDDMEHIDHSSLLVLDYLLRRARSAGFGLLLSHTTGSGPASGSGAAVEELLYRWQLDGLVDRRVLPGLPAEAVRELVVSVHPTAPPELSTRLSQVTAGHSVFVKLCLDAWKEEQGAEVTIPSTLTRVVEARLAHLTEADQELLTVGATEGSVFLSRTAASVLEQSHDRVMEQLRKIRENTELLVQHPLPAWARADVSDCYAFTYQALWSVVYQRQTPEQRRSRHERIAAALAAQAQGEPLLGRRLEIARHLKRGGSQCLAACSDAYYGLARDAAVDGLSFSEAEQHCEEAIRTARELPPTVPGRDRRLVLAVELLLSLSEVRWRGQHRDAGVPDIDGLAAEAEEAAARCGDRDLMIRTTLMRGKTQLATRGLVPGLEKLRRAVELAEEHGDPVALFVARVEYGRQVSKRRLEEGLAQLEEAERMYAADPRLGGSGDPVLQHARNLAEMQLGISLFDSGRLTEAVTRLRRCVDRLRGETLKAELPIALNYLAQVLTGLGQEQPAADVLREALDFEVRRGGDSGWHAYNTALLAQLYSHDPQRAEETLALAADAWAETERTWLANLVPIVRNLYADVLLRVARQRAELLEQADRLAVDTIRETAHSGMIRSTIAAHSLRSRTFLRKGDTVAAVAEAEEALRILDEVGPMPALRTEEVLYHAGVAMRRGGRAAQADGLLDRAREEVARKRALITDPAMRESFGAERLNRVILGEGGGAA